MGALALSIAFTWMGCAHMAEAPKTVTREQTLSARAKVVELDLEQRVVTLQGNEGRTLRFRAGPEVRNLEQVRVGDEVAVQYSESLLMRVMDPSEPSFNQSSAGGARAQPGELPAGVVSQQVSFTVTVISTDKAAGTVTFSMESGEIRTMRVADPKNLDLVKPNDRVAVTYAEALAIKVETLSP
jgi:hypothetical protein